MIVWDVVINQLIKEFGPSIDFEKFNILLTDFTYQEHSEKLPQEVIDEIIKNTEIKFNKIVNK